MSYLKFVKTKLHNKILSNPTISKAIVATTAGIATANVNLAMMRCDSLEGSTDARDSIINILFEVYRKWWWIPLAFAALAWFGAKDDKIKEMGKKWCIGLVVIFVGTFAWDAIIGTITNIATAFS